MKIDFFNPRSIILFVCLLQGVIFAALLFIRARCKRSAADAWLGMILLVMCSGLITAFVGFAHVYNVYQGLTYFPFELVFALAPCIYLYTLSLTDSARRFTGKDLLHFIPAAIYIIYRLILFSQDLDLKNWYDDNINVPYIQRMQNILLFAWNAVYFYLSLRHYYGYRVWIEHNYSNTLNIKFGWLRNFLFLFGGLLLLSAAFELTNSFVVTLSYGQIFYYEVVLALLVYYLAIVGYLRSESVAVHFLPEAEKPAKIKRADDLGRQKKDLEDLMASQKPYLEPELTLADLARIAGMNSGALSRVINSGFGMNFNDFVNTYRIDECKARLRQGAPGLSLLGVAFECGFNSKATFNRAFKKLTGLAPSAYTAD